MTMISAFIRGSAPKVGVISRTEPSRIPVSAASPADSPKVTLTTYVVSFGKLMAGKAQGPQLYMTGKLKIQGDLMLAQRATTFFRPAGS